MEILSRLFGSEGRVKIMRLFLFNPESAFDVELISMKAKTNKQMVRKELSLLEKIRLIRKKVFWKAIKKKKGKKIVDARIKSKGFELNQDFPYITGLKQLLVSTKTLGGGEIISRLNKAGKLKLVIVSGVFTQDRDSRLDMLVVGDNLKKPVLNSIIRSIEAEFGKELLYAHFETPDFQYRLSMYDKLIRDVLDYPHQVLLDKLS